MEMEQQITPNNKKKLSTADWIALAGGIFVAQMIFKLGDFGFLPAFIIAFGSYWLIKQIVMLFTKEKTSSKKKEINISDGESLEKLQKLYKTTGIWSMVLAGVGFIFAMAIGFKPEHIVSDAIVALVFAFPRFFFGLKLKNDGIKNLQYASNISLGMAIYSTIVALVNLLSFSGWLYWILIFLYFKSYRNTKQYLSEISKNEKSI